MDSRAAISMLDVPRAHGLFRNRSRDARGDAGDGHDGRRLPILPDERMGPSWMAARSSGVIRKRRRSPATIVASSNLAVPCIYDQINTAQD